MDEKTIKYIFFSNVNSYIITFCISYLFELAIFCKRYLLSFIDIYVVKKSFVANIRCHKTLFY